MLHRLSCLMRRVFSILGRLPRLVFIGLVRAYQLLLSPHMPRTCRFHPTCSAYAIQSFQQYGALKGLVLTVYRLLRCHPWGGHGYDPPRWFGEEQPQTSTHTDIPDLESTNQAAPKTHPQPSS